MPLQATSGAASYDAFGGGVPVVPAYIEEVFSTYLYTGNGNTAPETQTITNGIDLSGKGGLVWIKNRSAATNNVLFDTARGATKVLVSNATSAESTDASTLTSFNNNGFSVYYGQGVNGQNNGLASWTFRKQPKFFDVVTYTGTGSTRTVAHNLGSVPGCIIIKNLSDTDGWLVYHRSIGATKTLGLNTTGAADNEGATYFNDTEPTSTVFTVKEGGKANASGNNYVAYLFAHNAGGFGLTGTDNVISCGSFTTDGSANFSVNLGYEPQWVLLKRSSGSGDWFLIDNMRGWTVNGQPDSWLLANTSNSESSADLVGLNATGFESTSGNLSASSTYIYIAIRRGPMKVPTSGTSVFAPVIATGTGANTNISSGGFAPDMLWNKNRDHAYGTETWDKLRGVRAVGLTTSNTGAEGLSPAGYDLVSFNNTGVTEGSNSGSVMNISSWLYVNYMFGRAPSFFDEVCYTASISAEQTFNHNLGVTPELIFLKRRDSARNWVCWQYQGTNGLTGTGQFLNLNLTAEANATTTYNDGYVYGVSATQFAVNGFSSFNNVNSSCVAYLFATCAGVSKVGSYTGTATTKQIDCGFTGGARFVLIKRTDSTGDWYVWDSARGIVSGNDPYLLLNSNAAEVTSTDYIDTYSAGFEISSTAPAAINASGGTFVFLAIA